MRRMASSILWCALLILLLPGVLVAGPVEVTGVSGELQANIAQGINSFEPGESLQPVPRIWKRRARQAAEALGYYKANFNWREASGKFQLHVVPGERVRWMAPRLLCNGVECVGKLQPTATLTAAMHAGEGLDHREYEKLKSQWLAGLWEAGLLDAKYSHSELRVDLDSNTAQAILLLETGEAYLLDRLEFSGSRLDVDLLKRLASLEQGQVLSYERLSTAHRNFETSGYFSSIDIRTIKTSANTATLKIALVDAPRMRVGVGAGFGTDTGLRGRLRLQNPALTHSGHKFSNEIQVSEIGESVTSTYQVPLSEPLDKYLEFGASYEREDVEDILSTIAGVTAFYRTQWQQNWQANMGASIFYEEADIGLVEDEYTLYGLPSFHISRTWRPELLDPLRGGSLLFGVAGSTPELGADTDFLRLHTQAKRLVHLGGGHTLLGKIEAGALVTDSVKNTPVTQRFFAGGDQSVRGYDYRSLSPVSEEGVRQGGQYLNVGSLEYSFRFRPRWRAALFVDTGRAYDDSSARFNTGAGFGVRWLSPIGQVRIDLASPVDNPLQSGWRLHISMGDAL